MPVFDAECGANCRSRKHALEINAVVTKGSLKEFQAYFHLCYNASHGVDTMGRTALHLAAACGKCDIIEWLLTEKHVDISAKDSESGWTALHRSIFYGQLQAARLLIQFISDIHSKDHEGLETLDLIVKDRPKHLSYSAADPSEVYSWGDNTNFTLGHTKEHRRQVPESVDVFRKLNVSIKQVVLCKYHTVFLSQCGQVYTCGHGQGGRLGHGDEQTCVIPRLVETVKHETCIQVAAARDHTVILTKGGIVYSCGLNNNHQLGQFPIPAKALEPKQVNARILRGRTVLGVSAGCFHTVIYTNNSLFTLGLNAGQLGEFTAHGTIRTSSSTFNTFRTQLSFVNHVRVAIWNGYSKGEIYQSNPRLVPMLNVQDVSFRQVACSSAATVCLTTKGDVCVLHEYQCRRIVSKRLDIMKVQVSGGHLDHSADLVGGREKGSSRELIISLLLKSGKVLMWRSLSPVLGRCHWPNSRQLVVTDIALSENSLSITTDDGEAFVGPWSEKRHPVGKEAAVWNRDHHGGSAKRDPFAMVTLLDMLLKDEVEEIDLKRVSNIYRATAITVDAKGKNFAFLQSSPKIGLTSLPVIEDGKLSEDFGKLLETAHCMDSIHDIILKVGDQSFPAHCYILCSRSDYFRKAVDSMLFADYPDSFTRLQITVDDIHPSIMMQVLKFLYTDSCDLLTVGAKVQWEEYGQQQFKSSIIHENLLKSISSLDIHPISKKGSEKPASEKALLKKTTIGLLQNAAWKLGVKALIKRVETVKIVNGLVHSIGEMSSVSKLKFDQKNLPDLYDVCIKTSNEAVFHCHKCVLVARSEYFSSMLSNDWIETSSNEAMHLPIPGDIMMLLLNYLYTDDVMALSACENMELLCNVLVVADQLLIHRLKEICEVALVHLITLRNAADLLEFASLYNATQLKTACHQYICLNLAALLEGRNLDVLSADVIDQLSSYYRNQIPTMSCRLITPYAEGPDADYLEALAMDYSKNGGHCLVQAVRKAKIKRRQKGRKCSSESSVLGSSPLEEKCNRETTVSSDNSVRVEEDNNGWTVVSALRSSSVEPESVQMKKCNDEPEQNSSQQPAFTLKLTVRDKKNPWGTVLPPETPSTSSPLSPVNSLMDIMAEEDHLRRKQQPPLQLQVKVPAKGQTPPLSFKDVLFEKSQSLCNKTNKNMSNHSKHMLSWGLPTTRIQGRKSGLRTSENGPDIKSSPPPALVPDNPWGHKSESAFTCLSFSDIVKDEIHKSEMCLRFTRKPLKLIQQEEQAIQELLVHYKAASTFHEHITVEWETPLITAPIWSISKRGQSHMVKN